MVHSTYDCRENNHLRDWQLSRDAAGWACCGGSAHPAACCFVLAVAFSVCMYTVYVLLHHKANGHGCKLLTIIRLKACVCVSGCMCIVMRRN